jgi:beta-phosphoglucomutase-like phosphatase (HAD superfamily)
MRRGLSQGRRKRRPIAVIPLDPGVAGLIFDFDGTLADTMPQHYLAWSDVLNQHGGHFPEELFYSLGGKSTLEIVKILNGKMGYELDPVRVAADKEDRFLAYLDQVRPIEPVVELAHSQRGKMPMAIGSGNLRWLVERTLEVIGMVGFFDVIVTIDDVQQGKPAPETFLLAAAKMGVEPARCQVFEDGELGLQAARQAGMVDTDIRLYVD